MRLDLSKSLKLKYGLESECLVPLLVPLNVHYIRHYCINNILFIIFSPLFDFVILLESHLRLRCSIPYSSYNHLFFDFLMSKIIIVSNRDVQYHNRDLFFGLLIYNTLSDETRSRDHFRDQNGLELVSRPF